jgi:hypothetical protein
MLPSLVIKIEYCRTLHRGSKEPSRPSPLSRLPALEKAPISRFPATNKPSISTFAAAFLTETASHSEIVVTDSKQMRGTFLTETRIAPLALHQGTAFYPELRRVAVPSLACPDEEKSFRAGRHGFRVNLDRIHPERICEGRDVAFLIGSGLQTEFAVSCSKQTIGKFLTGARTHIKEFANPHFSAPKNLLLHRRPIQIFLRPTI